MYEHPSDHEHPPTRRGFLAAAAAGSAAMTAASYARVAGANERVGVGCIGYGLIGKNHVGTFRKLPDVAITAMCDVHNGRVLEGAAAAEAPGARAAAAKAAPYADFRKLLDDKSVDAVVVATPDHWHALMTMMACAAGKDVYVEKPLTLFVREGEWMQAVAARTGRVVQVGTQQRSGGHYRRARDLIRGGAIGKVTSVRMSCLRNVHPGFGKPPDGDPPAELDWDLWLGPAPARRYNPSRGLYHFRWFWDTSGGQMTNLGAHHLDIVDWCLGLDGLGSVSSVGGRYALSDNGETPDTQDALFDLGGWSAAFDMRECAVGARSGFGLEFFGTRGSLGIDRRAFRIIPDADIPPINQLPGVRSGHPVGGPTAVPPSAPAKPRTEAVEDNTGDSPAQYLAHARDFVDCIRSRKTPVSGLASAHRTSLACHLANLSLRLGRSLKWDAQARTVAGDPEAAAALTRPYRTPWDRELRALITG
jgi:predicted dehydrogenase